MKGKEDQTGAKVLWSLVPLPSAVSSLPMDMCGPSVLNSLIPGRGREQRLTSKGLLGSRPAANGGSGSSDWDILLHPTE